MHKGGVYTMIFGGVILIIGVVIGGLGYYNASTAFDPSVDNIWEGDSGDTPTNMDITVTGSIAYNVYVEDGAAIPTDISVTNSTDELFAWCDEANPGQSCGETTGEYDRIGIFWIETNDTGPFTLDIEGLGFIYITQPVDDLGEFLGGGLTVIFGACIGICGFVVVIIGLILAFTLSGPQPVAAGYAPAGGFAPNQAPQPGYGQPQQGYGQQGYGPQ